MPVETTIRYTHEPATQSELRTRLERIDARLEQLTTRSDQLALDLLAMERTDGEVDFIKFRTTRKIFYVLKTKILNLHVKRTAILNELAGHAEQTA